MTIGEKIKILRKKREMSQKELAQIMNVSQGELFVNRTQYGLLCSSYQIHS